MNIILFDDSFLRGSLKPLSLNKPISFLRVGGLRISEKWQKYLAVNKNIISYLTEEYLSQKYKVNYGADNLYINSALLPDFEILKEIKDLNFGQLLVSENLLVAFRTEQKLNYGFEVLSKNGKNIKANFIDSLPALVEKNIEEIEKDINCIKDQIDSSPVSDPFSAVYNKEQIFVEKNVQIKSAILNAENGPIFIGEGSIIQEGAIIIGPAFIGKNCIIAYGAKIRPGTSLGENCRVGGEVGKSIFFANSNKAHDGFLGNSVVGEWCNLGANTNNSNLKNNYKPVSLYHYSKKKLLVTNEFFLGSFIADYSKLGISTMLNTGTVIGACSNVFGAGFQEKFVPSFSWGGKAEGYSEYKFDKALEVIDATMKRRDLSLDEQEKLILKYIFENREDFLD